MGPFALVRVVSVILFVSCIGLTYSERTDREDEDEDFVQRLFEGPENYIERRRFHRLRDWNRRASKRLANLNEYTKFRSDYLSHILRVRVPGTLGHHHVKNFIKNTLEKNGWTVELDEFTSKTPVGERKFTNIIGVLHPSADRRLALAAHYDSKDSQGMNLAEDEYFLGATDSAVPCAMLLDFAKQLGDRAKEKDASNAKVSPMLLFLDGEEAFENWSATDSLYGSRHLAKLLANRPHHNKQLASKDVTMLDALEAFVLFDLIGAKTPQPQFYNLYPSTSKLYSHLQDIENELKDTLVGRRHPYFPGKSPEYLEVEDDHRPFYERGVPILHVISIPFPAVWHQLGDNESALDEDTIINLLHIFRQFLREYFDLHKS